MRPPTTRSAMERREAPGSSQGPARPGTPTALKALGPGGLARRLALSKGWPDGASHAPWRLPALHSSPVREREGKQGDGRIRASENKKPGTAERWLTVAVDQRREVGVHCDALDFLQNAVT